MNITIMNITNKGLLENWILKIVIFYLRPNDRFSVFDLLGEHCKVFDFHSNITNWYLCLFIQECPTHAKINNFLCEVAQKQSA